MSDGERLQSSAALGDTLAARVMLWAGAEPNYSDPQGRTVLQEAVEFGDPEIALILLEAGADPDSVDDAGVPILVRAAGPSDLEMAATLLAAGADPNARHPDGESVLAKAIERDDIETFGLVLAAGADPNGAGVVDSAVELGNPEIAQALPDSGAFSNGSLEEIVAATDSDYQGPTLQDVFGGTLCVLTFFVDCPTP